MQDQIAISTKQKRISFWLVHAACLGALGTGVSPVAVSVCLGLYLVRMFGITGGYHRYFAHRSFKTSRSVQFLFAFLGCLAAQKGPLWWASHHREHHAYSDTPRDPHSPVQGGFWRSHVFWFFDPASFRVREERIKDFLAYPELRVLERYHWVPPVSGIGGLFLLGHVLGRAYPSLGTSGMQMLIWGGFISTVLLYHGTFSINSLGHLFGRARYETGDESRNSAWLALFTLGEGWHNNHHRYPVSARQGFFWWEFDPTYYVLWILARCGLIWDLKQVPLHVRESGLRGSVTETAKSGVTGAAKSGRGSGARLKPA